MIKKYFKIFWSNWYIPGVIAAGLLLTGYLILSLFTKTSYVVAIWIFYFSFFILLISALLGIKKFFNKDYLKGGLQFSVSILIFVIAAGYISFFMMFYPFDYFADELKLPENIKLELPLNSTNQKKAAEKSEMGFKLINSFQPGIYNYTFTSNKIDSGYVYLKVFEITNNTALSIEELNSNTKVFVYNKNDELKTFSTKDPFTIYEGDWNKPYGARFELWYVPSGKEKEKKILEKNYKIEGWQR